MSHARRGDERRTCAREALETGRIRGSRNRARGAVNTRAHGNGRLVPMHTQRTCQNPLCGRLLDSDAHASKRYCSRRCTDVIAWKRQGISPWVIEYLPHDPCAYCGGHDFWRPVVGIDHIVPRSQGGDDGWMNLTACCRNCNSGKQNRSLLDFMLRRLV